MHCITYRFRIPKRVLRRFLTIDRAADRLYRAHGLRPAVRIPYLIRPVGASVELLLVNIYRSKAEYERKSKLIDRDPRIQTLYAQCLRLFRGGKFETRTYTTR